MTEHFATSSFYVFPQDLNFGNTLFGGKLLAEIDCEASKVAKSVIYGSDADNTVTARFEVDFKKMAHQGDLIVMEADVFELGRTSMKINVDVFIKRGPDRKDWMCICSAKTVFVAVKDEKPFPHGKELKKSPDMLL